MNKCYSLKQYGSSLGLSSTANDTPSHYFEPTQSGEDILYLSLYPWDLLSTRQQKSRHMDTFLYLAEFQKCIKG